MLLSHIHNNYNSGRESSLRHLENKLQAINSLFNFVCYLCFNIEFYEITIK